MSNPSQWSVSILLVAAMLFWGGCSGSQVNNNNNGNGGQYRLDAIDNLFNLDQQVLPPRHIQSIELYVKGNKQSPPMIEMGTGDQLVLEFDYLKTEAKQFIFRISHRDPDWRKSSLPSDRFRQGLFEDYISDAMPSQVQNPAYRHYRYQFPNDNVDITASGNFMLTVLDYDSGQELFSLPFFVYENKGNLETEIETLYGQRRDIRRTQQPFSQFEYPDFVEMPQFDLSYYYVQDQFFGRTRKVNISSYTTPGIAEFHLGRGESFIGDYDIKSLDLTDISSGGYNVVNYQPGYTPPRVYLRRDVQNLTPTSDFTTPSRYGEPSSDRRAQYADVYFALEPAVRIDKDERLFVVGDFNRWSIQHNNQLHYDTTDGLWRGNAFIKEGRYSYKYVTVRNGEVQDLRLDNSFALNRHQYLTLVYFKDPEQHYHRLLQVGVSYSRN